MATILKNILSFTGLVIGVPVALPHRLNVKNISVIPRTVEPDVGGFTIAANATTVTVTRTVDGPAAVNVLVEYWHSIEAVVPLVPPPGQLAGQVPWIQQPGAGGGGGSSEISAANVLTFRPGSGLTGPVVFDDFNALYAQFDTLRSAAQNSGKFKIVFDDQDVGGPGNTVVLDSGTGQITYDFTYATLIGVHEDQNVLLDIQDGGGEGDSLTIVNALWFEGLTIRATGQDTAFDAQEGQTFTLTRTTFLGGGGEYVMDFLGVDGCILHLNDESAVLRDGVFPDGTAAVRINNCMVTVHMNGANSTVNGHAFLTGVGGTLEVFINEASAQVNENQDLPTPELTNQTAYRQFPTQVFTTAESPISADLQELVLVDNSGGDLVVQLPDIATLGISRGQSITVKNVYDSVGEDGGTITVAATDTIDGAATFMMTEPLQSVTFISDGVSAWRAVANSASLYSQPWAQCRFNFPTIEGGYNIFQLIENGPGDWVVEFKASIDTGKHQFFFQAIPINNTFPSFCVDGGAAPDPSKQIHVQAFRGDESPVNVTIKLTVWVVPIFGD